MKKLAIGCGLALVLTGIAAAGVAYYLLRQVSSTVAQFADLAKVPDIERAIRNRGPFTPPSSGELTDAQVEKLVAVQADVRRRIGERMKEFETKYKTFVDKEKAAITDAPAIIRAYGDLATTWVDAKRSQIEALNAAGLSLDEYRWIRDQAYRALGIPFVDLDLGKLADQARRGVTPETPGQLRGAVGPEGPAPNRTRVEKFRKLLEDNLALASFGL